MFLWVGVKYRYLKFVGKWFYQKTRLVVALDPCNYKSTGIVYTEYLSQSISVDVCHLILDPLHCPVHNVLGNHGEKGLSIHFHFIHAKSDFVLGFNKLLRNLDVVIHNSQQFATSCLAVYSTNVRSENFLGTFEIIGSHGVVINSIHKKYCLEIVNRWHAQSVI